ncbi:cation-translocating P-type ATPase [Nonomuraea helvata]|uniref:Cation-transporting P-type ATPase n=1 Tax=Nonomuraea helvata TaxID=37484 RepID=A0ABV5SCE9_9ACTN
MTSWHAVEAARAVQELGSNEQGLSEEQATQRRAEIGPNLAKPERREGFLEELAESLREPLQLLLIAVAVLSAIFGELVDALAIAAIIVAVALTETITEQRSARAISALKRMSAPAARVRRSGTVHEVPAADLVPGDVIVIEAGDLVPSDARVLEAEELRVDESSLTGETVPVGKAPLPVTSDADLAERSSMVYAGTPVTRGEGTALVVETGPRTELGRLGRLVTDEREPATPLQQALSRLAKVVLVIALAASVLVPLVGLITGQEWRQMLLAGLTLAFATIPEELPILITVLLAVGGRQLAKRGALLRRLRAGETLGVVTTVVTDKTGTLTENRLRLAKIVGEEDDVLRVAMAAQPPHGRDPLEAELAAVAAERGIRVDEPVTASYPFDPVRKTAARLRGTELVVVGAPEEVITRCRNAEGRPAVVEQLSRDGLRVLAFARRSLHEPPTDRDDAERDLEFVGLAAFDDPLRTGADAAVAQLADAGVATIVVSGDHPATVAAIAVRAGLPTAPVLTGGAALGCLDDQHVTADLTNGTVIARATPEDKLRVVRLLQARGDVVAVTGDGVNDAPALAAADVGIAMGRRGSDLARQAADLVLTDDAYPTVAAAVAKGRNIGSQLRRAVAFYLGAKLALVTIMLVALALGHPVVFTPSTIVLLELFMDLGASVAFVAEPAAPGAMHRPPRPARSGFLAGGAGSAIVATGLALTTAVLLTYLYVAAHGTLGQARTAAVIAWLAGHALIAWSLRAQPSLSWQRNPAFPIWAAAALAVGVLVVITPLSVAFHLAPIDGHQLVATSIAVGAGVLITAVARIAMRLGTRL